VNLGRGKRGLEGTRTIDANEGEEGETTVWREVRRERGGRVLVNGRAERR